LLSVGDHRPELVEPEVPAVLADPLLDEEGRSGRVQPDGDAGEEQDRQDDWERDDRQDKVHHPLDGQVYGAVPRHADGSVLELGGRSVPCGRSSPTRPESRGGSDYFGTTEPTHLKASGGFMRATRGDRRTAGDRANRPSAAA